MINLLGMTEDEAKTALKELGLGYKNVGTASSDEYEAGKIMTQSVKAGDSVAANESIKVTVSSGKGENSIPNVVGSSESSAEQTLKDAGFKVNKTYEHSKDVESGKVISQNPAATSNGKEGDTITIVVSQGVESVKVPTITGMTQEEATNALASVGLGVGNITSDNSENVEAGKVISQGTSAGSYVDAGATVDFVISLGKKEVVYKYTWAAPEAGHVKVVDDTGYVGYEGDVTAGQTISVTNLKSQGGTLYFTTAEKETTDAEGNVTTTPGTTTTTGVQFTKQE
jgi:serine/threonine-protein kinase